MDLFRTIHLRLGTHNLLKKLAKKRKMYMKDLIDELVKQEIAKTKSEQ